MRTSCRLRPRPEAGYILPSSSLSVSPLLLLTMCAYRDNFAFAQSVSTTITMYDAEDTSDSESMSGSSISRFAPSRATSATSDMSMRSPSPEPSVYSFTSSLREAAYRQLHGRHVNSYSDVYSLPADEEELQRLGSFGAFFVYLTPRSNLYSDRQHEMFKRTMGKYPPLLPAVLAEHPGVRKAAVDLGCGSGSW